jgi:hypothetical protein
MRSAPIRALQDSVRLGRLPAHGSFRHIGRPKPYGFLYSAARTSYSGTLGASFLKFVEIL